MSGALCVMAGGAAGPLVVTVSPALLTGTAVGAEGVTSASGTATISGGVGPYTGFWSRQFGSVELSAINPNATTTLFGGYSLTPGVPSFSAFFMFTATDAVGATAVSDNLIEVIITR